jgi:hypothetical protein
MTEHARCPRCRRENPSENRFCASCGASLGPSSALMARRANNPTMMGHALPVRPGPVGKALAVGLVTLAAQAGLSWLRHRATAEDRPSTLTTRESDTAASERLLARSLEEMFIQESEGHYRSRVLAWRAISSIVITEPIDRRS